MIKTILENNYLLYLLTFLLSLIISLIFTPLFRRIALKFDILDHPTNQVKTHNLPTPYLGGIPIWLGWAISLFIIRFFTHFPTGTLRNLRGILVGSIIILILGLIDDSKPSGIGFKRKFLVQFIAAIAVFMFDIRLHFVSPYLLALGLSLLWIVGITNAFNIIDIMDGLSSGIAFIASLAFLFIALPTEQIYVNFCAAALAGACLGFIPFNLSKRRKIFMGDTGSLVIGFILASLSMGTSYTEVNEIGLFAPIFILAIPLYDTGLVMYIRWLKGKSPFMGSKDHFALRLEEIGYNRKKILFITYIAGIILSFVAFLFTRLTFIWALLLFSIVAIIAVYITFWLGKIQIKD